MTLRRATSVLLVLSFVCLSASAPAEPMHGSLSNRAGLDVGLRVGYGIPFGDIDGNRGSLADWVTGAVPFVIEAGYRFNRHLTMGPTFQYAYVQVKQNGQTGCTAGSGCTGWDFHAGFQALYRLDVEATMVPWFGLGVGYEWTNYSGSVAGVGFSGSAAGWELANLQLGGDVPVGTGFTVGPYVSFSVGRYDSESGALGTLNSSSGISNPALHAWLQFGARFAFSL